MVTGWHYCYVKRYTLVPSASNKLTIWSDKQVRVLNWSLCLLIWQFYSHADVISSTALFYEGLHEVYTSFLQCYWARYLVCREPLINQIYSHVLSRVTLRVLINFSSINKLSLTCHIDLDWSIDSVQRQGYVSH